MGRNLAVTTIVRGEAGSGVAFVVLGPDDEVPDWAQDQIGEHCYVNGPHADSGDGEYDPGDHTVAEVNDYLADADEDERDRVLQAEADGKARAGIVNGPHADSGDE